MLAHSALAILLLGATAEAAILPDNYILQKPLTSRRKLVLDIDGTLFPTETGLHQSLLNAIYNYTADKTRLPYPEAVTKANQLYYSRGLVVRGLIEEFDITGDDYEEYLASHVDYSIVPFNQGLISLLERVDADLIVFTNSCRIHTMRVLSLLQVDQLLHMVVFADYRSKRFAVKPHDDAFAIVEELLGVPAEQIYFLDDRPDSIETAVKRNWNCLLIDETFAGETTAESRVARDISSLPIVFPDLMDPA